MFQSIAESVGEQFLPLKLGDDDAWGNPDFPGESLGLGQGLGLGQPLCFARWDQEVKSERVRFVLLWVVILWGAVFDPHLGPAVL